MHPEEEPDEDEASLQSSSHTANISEQLAII